MWVKISLTFIALLTSVNAIAASERDSLIDSFVEDLRPFVRTLDRNIRTYNYTPRERLQISQDSSPIALINKSILDNLREQTGGFFSHAPDTKNFLGYGLYLAQNPFESAPFGGENWVLTEVELPKGARLLDIRTNYDSEGLINKYNFPISTSTFQAWQEKCETLQAEQSRDHKSKVRPYTRPFASKEYHFVSKMDLTRDEYCNDLFLAAIQKLEIDAVQYKWHGNVVDAPCDGIEVSNQKSAFVLTDSSILNENSIRSFVANLEPDASLEKIVAYVEVQFSTQIQKSYLLGLASQTNGDERDELFNKADSHAIAEWPNHTSLNDYKERSVDLAALIAKYKESSYGCDLRYMESDSPKILQF